MDLLAWWNLVFELPFFTAFGYIFLLATGSVGADHDVDLDADIDHDVHFGHDVGDHDLDHDMHHEPGSFMRALSFLGLGKVPISIIFITFCFIWGFSGWGTNLVLSKSLPPAMFIFPSLGVATVSSVVLTRYVAKGLARIMPKTETYGVSTDQLVGFQGNALFEITEDFGQVHVRDGYGNLRRVSCVVRAGQGSISQGSWVLLDEFDPERDAFYVTLDPFEELEGRHPRELSE